MSQKINYPSDFCGIYEIKNNLNGKVYIGLSRGILSRWKEHLGMLRKGEHHSAKLQEDFDALGVTHFSFSILEICSSAILEEREIYWISKKDSERNGYNMTNMSYRPQKELHEENDRLRRENVWLRNKVEQLFDEIDRLKGQEQEPETEDYTDCADGEYTDELYNQAYSLVIDKQVASVSMIQRYLRVGYSRAVRLIRLLEKNGVIGKHAGSKPRQVLRK